MRNVLTVLCIVFFVGHVKSQVAVYDAIKLKSLSAGSRVYSTDPAKISLPQSSPVYSILKYYVPPADSTAKQNIEMAFDDNPFMGYEVKSFGGNTSAGLNLLPSAAGGLDITTIADGFAKFLVKRTKEELTVTFFNKFKEFISKPEYVDLQTVFPQTYQALTIIGDEIYNYQRYIQTLRESFEKDLAALPANLPTIIANHPTFFNAHPGLAALLNSGCYIAQQLTDKVHPGDILANYPAEYLDPLNPNWKGAIQTLQLISASLRDTCTNTDSVYWVGSKQIKELTDPVTFKIYLGLIYQKAKLFNKDAGDNYVPIAFAHDTLTSVLKKAAPVYTKLTAYISGFGEKANKLNALIKQYKKPANDSLAIAQYYTYAKASIDLLKQASTLTDIPAVKKILNIDLPAEMKDYFDAAQSSADIVLNISKRNYSAAIVSAVHIYDLVKGKQAASDVKAKENAMLLSAGDAKTIKKDAIKTLKDINDINVLKAVNMDSLLAPHISQAESDALNNLDTLNKLKAVTDVKNSLFKYGSFMAAMVQAKNSDEVENAIEAFALPSGSSSIKRESEWNIALNAYVGPYIGKEKIKGLDDKSSKVNAWGITAPIGVSLSRGRSFLFFPVEWHSSSTIFFSVVDLGAITAFRFNDDKTESVPTVQLKDIVSPGVFYSHGFGKTPLSLNVGWQMGPLLRKVAADQNTYSNQYSRLSVSLVVDIPVLNFYSKSK